MPDKCNAVKELKSQFGNALLIILTFGAVVAAFINFQQNFQETKRFRLPEDGVTWVDRARSDGGNSVIALHVADDSPAARNGIKAGDRLLAIGSEEFERVFARWFDAFIPKPNEAIPGVPGLGADVHPRHTEPRPLVTTGGAASPAIEVKDGWHAVGAHEGTSGRSSSPAADAGR